MKIVLDAMGSDLHPGPEIEAAVTASEKFGIEVILVGQEERVRSGLEAALRGKNARVSLVHAPDVLEMTDKPAENARRKAQNSMAVGLGLLHEGQADAFVTAGNTGGAMVNALFQLGRLRGVKRPALTALFPVRNGKAVVLDIGANAECKAEYLLQFAVMGSLYAEKMLNKPKPRLGLLSNGEEEGKGNELIHAASPLLAASGLNFCGNVEPKELFAGKVDVVVTDGFTGNILLKTSESAAKFLTDILKQELMSGLGTKIGALLAKPAFTALKKAMDPGEVGAVPLLGVDGLVFVGHGRSDAHALVNAIGQAHQAVQADLLDAMRQALQARLAGAPLTENS